MIINFVVFLTQFLLLAALIFGLVQSRKNRFKSGFYAFLLLSINHIYLFIAPYTTNHLVDTYFRNNDNPPMGLTFGELAALLYLVPRLLEVTAFVILVTGLYRMWQLKPSS